MATSYRVLYGRIDAVNGAIPLVGELTAVRNFSVGNRLDDIGDGSVTVPISHETFSAKLTDSNQYSPLASDFAPGRMFVAIERGGVIVGGGIVWSRSFDIAGNALTLNFRDPRSYLERRVLDADFSYTDTDVATIINNSLSITGKYGPHNAIKLVSLFDASAVGVTATVEYEASELKNGWELIEDLSGRGGHVHTTSRILLNASEEFECYIVTRVIENDNSVAPKVFELGSNILSMNVDEDASTLAMQVYGSGQGFGALDQGETTASDTTSVTNVAGALEYPVYQHIYQATDVSSLSELREQMKWRLGIGKAPASLVSLTAHPEIEPRYGTYGPGDVVRVKASYGHLALDERFVVMSTTLQESSTNSTVAVELVQRSLFDLV